jgi:hypothetical protein
VGRHRRRKDAANTLGALQFDPRPGLARWRTPLYAILDQLSSRKGADIRRDAKEHKVELGFTPKEGARIRSEKGIRWGGRSPQRREQPGEPARSRH